MNADLMGMVIVGGVFLLMGVIFGGFAVMLPRVEKYADQMLRNAPGEPARDPKTGELLSKKSAAKIVGRIFGVLSFVFLSIAGVLVYLWWKSQT